jgi:HSP20 family protein
MNIARFEPWSFVDLLHRDLDRLVQHRDLPGSDGSPVADWVPAVDIDVSMDNGVLSVSGERLAIAPDNDTGVQRIERASGRFLRRFTLPETADAEAIAAKCSNGILEVTIPKAPEIQARRITVEAA